MRENKNISRLGHMTIGFIWTGIWLALSHFANESGYVVMGYIALVAAAGSFFYAYEPRSLVGSLAEFLMRDRQIR